MPGSLPMRVVTRPPRLGVIVSVLSRRKLRPRNAIQLCLKPATVTEAASPTHCPSAPSGPGSAGKAPCKGGAVTVWSRAELTTPVGGGADVSWFDVAYAPAIAPAARTKAASGANTADLRPAAVSAVGCVAVECPVGDAPVIAPSPKRGLSHE